VPTYDDFVTLINNTTRAEINDAWGYGGVAASDNIYYYNQLAYYLSSTENSSNTDEAWHLYFYAGGGPILLSGSKSTGMQVRCVK
jgi:hypothetical protein